MSSPVPWLRFHAYGVGLPKTGTTSLSRMMANFRSGHEASLDFLAEHAVARVRGEIDDRIFWTTVHDRFVPLRGEMDVVTCHHLYADILREKYPHAQFIVTYRDVRSWANSLLGLVTQWRRTQLIQRKERSWYSTYGEWISEGTFSTDPTHDGDDTAALPALMRSWATYMRVMSTVLPPERTLWIKTSELTERVPELADFLKVPVDSIVLDNVHSNLTPTTCDRFAIADRAEIDRVYKEHCEDFMVEHFPQEHASFFNRATVNGSQREAIWRDYQAGIDAQLVGK